MIHFNQYLVKVVNSFKIQEDHSDFFDIGLITQNDRTGTSTPAAIKLCI